MDPATYRELLRKAGRLARHPDDAEGMVQDTPLVALAAGRDDPAWLHAVMRNLAALQARGAVRRRQREQADVPYASVQPGEVLAAPDDGRQARDEPQVSASYLRCGRRRPR